MCGLTVWLESLLFLLVPTNSFCNPVFCLLWRTFVFSPYAFFEAGYVVSHVRFGLKIKIIRLVIFESFHQRPFKRLSNICEAFPVFLIERLTTNCNVN